MVNKRFYVGVFKFSWNTTVEGRISDSKHETTKHNRSLMKQEGTPYWQDLQVILDT